MILNVPRRPRPITSFGRIVLFGLLLPLQACGGGGGDLNRSYTPDLNAAQPFPMTYRSELLAFFRSYLNDPTQIREAAIAQPVQRMIGGRSRYVVCLRFNSKDALERYPGASERAAMFLDGRFDRLLENPREVCTGAMYAAFPELEKLTR